MKRNEEENYEILHILPKRSISIKPTKPGKYLIFILTHTYLQLLDLVAKCFAIYLCMFLHLHPLLGIWHLPALASYVAWAGLKKEGAYPLSCPECFLPTPQPTHFFLSPSIPPSPPLSLQFRLPTLNFVFISPA
jgi:hypothetical protein